MVITVCDHANELCPVFPVEVEKIHWSIEDPFRDWNSDPLQLDNFRETRRDLNERLQKFIERN